MKINEVVCKTPQIEDTLAYFLYKEMNTRYQCVLTNPRRNTNIKQAYEGLIVYDGLIKILDVNELHVNLYDRKYFDNISYLCIEYERMAKVEITLDSYAEDKKSIEEYKDEN